jgi:hypothetical protein
LNFPHGKWSSGSNKISSNPLLFFLSLCLPELYWNGRIEVSGIYLVALDIVKGKHLGRARMFINLWAQLDLPICCSRLQKTLKREIMVIASYRYDSPLAGTRSGTEQ